MRSVWLATGLALILSGAALFVSIFALVQFVNETEFEKDSIHLVDRGEFTADMVLKAIDRYKNEGREATVAYYNTPESTQGDWYVFILNEAHEIIAHADPNLLGEDVKGDIGVDSTGYRFGDSIIEATERGHWVDYMFDNPVTGNNEYKHTWVLKHDDLIFASGWYQILPQLP